MKAITLRWYRMDRGAWTAKNGGDWEIRKGKNPLRPFELWYGPKMMTWFKKLKTAKQVAELVENG